MRRRYLVLGFVFLTLSLCKADGWDDFVYLPTFDGRACTGTGGIWPTRGPQQGFTTLSDAIIVCKQSCRETPNCGGFNINPTNGGTKFDCNLKVGVLCSASTSFSGCVNYEYQPTTTSTNFSTTTNSTTTIQPTTTTTNSSTTTNSTTLSQPRSFATNSTRMTNSTTLVLEVSIKVGRPTLNTTANSTSLRPIKLLEATNSSMACNTSSFRLPRTSTHTNFSTPVNSTLTATSVSLTSTTSSRTTNSTTNSTISFTPSTSASAASSTSVATTADSFAFPKMIRRPIPLESSIGNSMASTTSTLVTSSSTILAVATTELTANIPNADQLFSCPVGDRGKFHFLGHELNVEILRSLQNGDVATFRCHDYLDNWIGNFSVECIQGLLGNFRSKCIASSPDDSFASALLVEADKESRIDGPVVILTKGDGVKGGYSSNTTVGVKKISISTFENQPVEIRVGASLVLLPSAIVQSSKAAIALKVAIVEHRIFAFTNISARMQKTAGPFVSVEVFTLSGRGEDWSSLPISNLEQPIILRLPLSPRNGDASNNIELACGFWDPAYGELSSSGVTLLNSTDQWVFCASTHLTMFAAFVKTASSFVSCGEFVLFSRDASLLAEFDWMVSLSGILIASLVALSVVLLCLAIRDDVKLRIDGHWADEDFLTIDPDYAEIMNHKLSDSPPLLDYITKFVDIVASSGSRMLLAAELRISVRDLNLTLQKRDRHRWQTLCDRSKHLNSALSRTLALVGDAELTWDDMKTTLTKAYCRNPFWQFWQLFVFLQPISTMTNYTLLEPRYLRVLAFFCRLYGGLCLSVICFLMHGKTIARDARGECRPSGGGWVASAFFGLLSFTSSNWVVLFLMLLHRRSFIYKEKWSRWKKYRQLCSWWCRDMVLVILTVGCSLTCLYISCVFVARVSEEDNTLFFFSAVAAMVKDWVIIPAALTVAMIVCIGIATGREQFLNIVHKDLGFHSPLRRAKQRNLGFYEDEDVENVGIQTNASFDPCLTIGTLRFSLGDNCDNCEEDATIFSSQASTACDVVALSCSRYSMASLEINAQFSTEVCLDTGVPCASNLSAGGESDRPVRHVAQAMNLQQGHSQVEQGQSIDWEDGLRAMPTTVCMDTGLPSSPESQALPDSLHDDGTDNPFGDGLSSGSNCNCDIIAEEDIHLGLDVYPDEQNSWLSDSDPVASL